MLKHIDFTKDLSGQDLIEVLTYFKDLDPADTVTLWKIIGQNRTNTILLHKFAADQIRNAVALQRKFASL